MDDDVGQQPSSTSAASTFIPRIADAGTELDSVCRAEISSNTTTSGNKMNLGFPPLCLSLVRLLSGNQCCVDCGEEQSDRLIYASVGYGTLLCTDCAYRHRTITPDESDVGHLLNEHWDLHSTLALFEGGNTNMLEFVKNKPGWKPSNKDKGSSIDPEDILAFKQVYLSHAASVYRKLLTSRTDKVKYIRINAMRQEDAAKEEVMDFSSYHRQSDPIQRILEQNNMSEDDVSGGLFKTTAKPGEREDKAGLSERTTGGVKQPHVAPNIDLIKQRINMRRAMNPSINALNQGVDEVAESEDGRSEMFMYRANSSLEQPTQQSANDTTVASQQQVRLRMRRSSADLIGEVGDTSNHNQYDEHA